MRFLWCAGFILLPVPDAIAVTRLNNFVTEHINVNFPSSRSYTFQFAEPGWVFVRTLAGQAACMCGSTR